MQLTLISPLILRADILISLIYVEPLPPKMNPDRVKKKLKQRVKTTFSINFSFHKEDALQRKFIDVHNVDLKQMRALNASSTKVILNANTFKTAS